MSIESSPEIEIIVYHDPRWQPATSTKLEDYDAGTLCRDSNGEMFLIGHCIEGTDSDLGCGCCSDKLTWKPIVEIMAICEFQLKTPSPATKA